MTRRLLVVLALAACGSPPPAPSTQAAPSAAPPAPARPAPGVDLGGPVPLPVRDGARRGTAVASTPVELGADRVVAAVEVPRPPRGGSVRFHFGDARDGWVARIPEGVQLPAVAYGDGRVYASGGFESVSFYAMDATTGRIAWATTALEDNGPTAPIYERGRVLFNTESCTLFALDATSGKRLWFRYLGDPTLAQPAVAAGLVFASHPSPRGQALSAYRVADGRVVWTHRIDSELLAAPVVHGDAVYASTTGGWTYRFARDTGRRAWARPLHATTAPWLAGDALYVTRHLRGKEQQIIVDAASGALRQAQHESRGAYAHDVPRNLDDWKAVWAFEGSRPVVDRGVRYVAMGGELVASDAASGAPLWERRAAARPDRRALGSVALAGSAIVVSTRDGQLFGLDVDTGYTLWAYAIGHPVVAEPVVAHGWVYVATRDGYVVGLHVGDTTLDGWHMFGGAPGHDGPVTVQTARTEEPSPAGPS